MIIIRDVNMLKTDAILCRKRKCKVDNFLCFFHKKFTFPQF